MLKALLAGAAALAIAAAAHAETYAIQAGRLIVDAAQPARGNSTVIVENGRIARIDSGFTAPAGAIVVDERSRTVMPGMTDVHVHLTRNSGEPWYAGFTQKYSNPYAATRRPDPRARDGARRLHHRARPRRRHQRRHRRSRRGRRRALSRARESRCRALRCRSSAAMPTQATGLPPELAEAVNEAHLNPSVCTGVEECQKVVRQLAAAGVDVIKIMATGGVLDPGAHGPRAAFHRRGDEGHRRHGACDAPQGRGPCARRARHPRGDQRRRRFDRARHLPRRGRRQRDEGARHLLCGDADGVQRSPAGCSAPAS